MRTCYDRCDFRSGLACRKLRLALMASLALNVLIIGAVAGTFCFSRLGHGSGRPRAARARPLSGFAHTLPARALRYDPSKARQREAEYGDPAQGHSRRAPRRSRGAHAGAFRCRRRSMPRSNASCRPTPRRSAPRWSLFATPSAQLTPDERRQLHDWFEKGERFRRLRDEDAPPPPPPAPYDRWPRSREAGALWRAPIAGLQPTCSAKKSGCTARSSTVTARQPLAESRSRASDVPCISSSVRARQMASEPAFGDAARPFAADRQDDLDELAVGHGHSRDAGRRTRRARSPRTAC